MEEKKDSESEILARKKRRPFPIREDYSESYLETFKFEGVRYEFDKDPNLFIKKR